VLTVQHVGSRRPGEPDRSVAPVSNEESGFWVVKQSPGVEREIGVVVFETKRFRALSAIASRRHAARTAYAAVASGQQ
jgi:hypothetical protein